MSEYGVGLFLLAGAHHSQILRCRLIDGWDEFLESGEDEDDASGDPAEVKHQTMGRAAKPTAYASVVTVTSTGSSAPTAEKNIN